MLGIGEKEFSCMAEQLDLSVCLYMYHYGACLIDCLNPEIHIFIFLYHLVIS